MASILNWKSRGIKVRPPSGSGSGRGTLSTFTSLKFLTILAKKRQRVVFATVSPKHFRFPENNDGSKIGWKDLENILDTESWKVPAFGYTLWQKFGKFRKVPVWFCTKRHLAIWREKNTFSMLSDFGNTSKERERALDANPFPSSN